MLIVIIEIFSKATLRLLIIELLDNRDKEHMNILSGMYMKMKNI